MPGGVRTEIHLDRVDTQGAFCLLVDHPPVGWSLPPHVHHGVAETIHIVDGEFELMLGGRRFRLVPGQTIHVPADMIHSTSNVGAGPGQRVLIFSPAGMEEFFLQAGAPSAEAEVDGAAVVAAAVRHGWEFVPDAVQG
jgi:mannose-6-phosphate isomerase-like protein (cupin superfamily)